MIRSPLRAAAVGALAAGALLAPASPAIGQLGLPLPGLGQVVTDVGGTVGGVLPAGGGGVVTGATGTVGGLVTGTTGTVTGSVDQVLGGVLGGGGPGGLLPTDALNILLGTLGIPLNGTPGAGGAGGSGAGGVVPGPGGFVLDARSPNARFTVMSKLRRIAQTGRIPLRVTTDEAGIVAFKGSVRPGKARKVAQRKGARKAAAVSRKPIKFPSAVLGFRKAGSLRVTIQLSRTAQRKLGKVRDARMSLAVVTADVRRNQGKATVKRVVRR
jgi:hypothetical protein